ncbi:hypothetical protein XH98_20850 [Bradyrhizobium sp. CCBAU 51745]|uniref:hypothetical protein n=1 Tax=Bradyrhizobium sp. CCBAU 51745 TaxID=1325099 RepID=UPI002306DA71|nr:hypothetical protein [Bradyrhizobium sp. CCBAU 51745]MDA9441489.1 hypothetical protein [Bradyrhizobium sp. CCBAU 51745]
MKQSIFDDECARNTLICSAEGVDLGKWAVRNGPVFVVISLRDGHTRLRNALLAVPDQCQARAGFSYLG